MALRAVRIVMQFLGGVSVSPRGAIMGCNIFVYGHEKCRLFGGLFHPHNDLTLQI